MHVKIFWLTHIKIGELDCFYKPCRMDLVLSSLKFLRSWGSKSSPKAKFPPGQVKRHLSISSHLWKSRSSPLFACEMWHPKPARKLPSTASCCCGEFSAI